MLNFFSHRTANNTHGIFRQVPLAVKGRLYVSPMPFGAYDTGNRVLALYKEKKIDHIFLIATDEEIRKKARRDLKKDYEKLGVTYRQLAIPDMTAPDLETLRDFVLDAAGRLATTRIVVHCHAGVGRTSVVTCCIVQHITGMKVEDTIAYVKKHMEVNMTAEQMSVVNRFAG